MNEDKASRYHRLRRRAELAGTAAALCVLIALVVSGASHALRDLARASAEPLGVDSVWGTAAGLAVLLVLLLQLVELPFAYYQGFLLEHRYGLSRESPGQWLADQTKGLAITLLIAAAGAAFLYATLAWSPGWWWFLSAASFTLVGVGVVQLAPVLLLPLFYTFKPLDRPGLSERLVALAARARTQIAGVYEWGLGAHTRKANAALAGMGRTRRILLSDTLLADYSDDEIEVILAHELSHHVHHDLWRGVAFQAALLFAAFFAADRVLEASAGPLRLQGKADPAGLPLLVLVGVCCSCLFLPAGNALSRAHERRADRYALDLTRRPEAFISAMRRLAQQNLAEERPSRVVRWLFYSHPPIPERIQEAKRFTPSRASSADIPAQRTCYPCTSDE